MSRTHIIFIISSITLLLIVLELVRRRRLREEYAWLWLLTSIVYLAMALSPALGKWVANFIGASSAALAFTFLGLQFLVLILIQFSSNLSRLTTQIKDLAQHLAIIDCEITKLNNLDADKKVQDQREDFDEIVQQIKTVDQQLANLESKLDELTWMKQDGVENT